MAKTILNVTKTITKEFDVSEIFWESAEASSDLSPAFESLIKQSELGFWQLPDREENWVKSAEVAESLKDYEKLFVIGQGGSALGGKLLVESLGKNEKSVYFLNDFDPEAFESHLDLVMEPAKTAWLVISKSGNTLEVLAMLTRLLNYYEDQNWELFKHLKVITEGKESLLRNWAIENAVELIDHPLDVGGRFAGLTPVGLIPAGFAGLNLQDLRHGASVAVQAPKNWLKFLSTSLESTSKNEQGISVFWTYSDRLRPFGPWLQQLWSESLGKSGIESISTPMLSHGSADQHSLLQQYMEGMDDKNYVIIREKDIERRGPKLDRTPFTTQEFINGKTMGEILYAQSKGTESALREAGRPVQIIEVQALNESNLGELMMSFELMVGTLGEHLKFDAFNQPGVEAGKKITRDLLS